MRVLASYDGSVDAQEAIDRAARLMAGAETTVLTVWEPIQITLMRTNGMGMGVWYSDERTVDAASEEAARATAAEGADRATAGGLLAEPRIVARQDSIAAAILAMADDLDVDAIVLGTRGLTGVRSILLGSVSHAVLQHADRSVLVVPSPAIVKGRRKWIHRREPMPAVDL